MVAEVAETSGDCRKTPKSLRLRLLTLATILINSRYPDQPELNGLRTDRDTDIAGFQVTM